MTVHVNTKSDGVVELDLKKSTNSNDNGDESQWHGEAEVNGNTYSIDAFADRNHPRVSEEVQLGGPITSQPADVAKQINDVLDQHDARDSD